MKQDCDAIGLLCPLPVLRARKRLSALAAGDILVLQTDDPAAIIDVPHFCQEAGHTLLDQQESEGGVMIWQIQKAD
ncbi:sulfurtransferase TusA family protein [Pseudoprimorskyibacter insulae]|uniref:Sulfurtransferase TusA n=1 Tax=Pseudoprimorskyibacter insulae TaxID=1695997 RepID=A0A2R8AVW4_9RHOB|nr:sulfurtransferase TusA family protein [Pseudoprimorskyibacter insulae]SPF80150.1 Sulfurtransferase TusA [Pseudoprimorskyibacter insulae]